MKRKIGALEGRGVLCAEGKADLEVYYTITVTEEPFRTVPAGEGKVWADPEELKLRVGPARLLIRGGREILIALRPPARERYASLVTQSPIPGYW